MVLSFKCIDQKLYYASTHCANTSRHVLTIIRVLLMFAVVIVTMKQKLMEQKSIWLCSRIQCISGSFVNG